MRPLSVITMTMAGILSAPVTLWSIGLSPHWILEVHLVALGMVLRLLVMAASLGRSAKEVAWVGLYGGALSSLFTQILLHSPQNKANVAAAFSAYGSLGARLYQLNEVTRWWPYAISLGDAFVYGVIAILAFHYVKRIRTWEISNN